MGKGIEKVVEGRLEGSIAESPRGTNGFGYDPLFVPEGSWRSYAEMSIEEKNKISHRALAVSGGIEVLRGLK